MREPQATSRLGALRQLSSLPRCRALLAAVIACASTPCITHAQIRMPSVSPSYGWWISGGASAMVLGQVNDGASNSTWLFGSDPRVNYRATLEKALDEFTTVGVVGGYGVTDVIIRSTLPGANAALPSACQGTCAATTEVWTGMAQFRSGGGTGFHTLFEASGGATTFRNFKVKSDTIAIAGIKSTFDLSGTIGAGFGYPLSRGMVVALVQDFGIGFHSKTNLPDGTSRTWRVRNTRASLRMKFGGR